jgi:hypothetical protein
MGAPAQVVMASTLAYFLQVSSVMNRQDSVIFFSQIEELSEKKSDRRWMGQKTNIESRKFS